MILATTSADWSDFPGGCWHIATINDLSSCPIRAPKQVSELDHQLTALDSEPIRPATGVTRRPVVPHNRTRYSLSVAKLPVRTRQVVAVEPEPLYASAPRMDTLRRRVITPFVTLHPRESSHQWSLLRRC